MNSLSTLWYAIAIATAHLPATSAGAQTEKASRAPVVITPRARELHASALVVDGHNDLPWELRQQVDSSFDRLDIAELQPTLHTDIPKLRRGGVGGQFWSVYVPVSTAERGRALATTLEQISLVEEMMRRYPNTFELALTSDDLVRMHEQGKIASLIGVEGGHCIENSLAVLNKLYELGARYMTLTHSESLDWADSATGDVRHNGLTPFGEQVVAEMNRLGMLVDLSHVTPAVMKQTLAISKAPVIFSHSSARGVADHPRNVPDDVLPLVADNGGVVMVNFYSAFVVPEGAARDVNRLDYRRQITAELVDSEDRDREVDALLARWDDAHPATRGSIHDVIDHIDHIVMLAGIDHVGLGSDYDGVSLLPQQLEDASCYPYITQALLDRGYSDQDVRQILGRNAVRALRDAEAVSRELRKRDSK